MHTSANHRICEDSSEEEEMAYAPVRLRRYMKNTVSYTGRHPCVCSKVNFPHFRFEKETTCTGSAKVYNSFNISYFLNIF